MKSLLKIKDSPYTLVSIEKPVSGNTVVLDKDFISPIAVFMKGNSVDRVVTLKDKKVNYSSSNDETCYIITKCTKDNIEEDSGIKYTSFEKNLLVDIVNKMKHSSSINMDVVKSIIYSFRDENLVSEFKRFSVSYLALHPDYINIGNNPIPKTYTKKSSVSVFRLLKDIVGCQLYVSDIKLSRVTEPTDESKLVEGWSTISRVLGNRTRGNLSLSITMNSGDMRAINVIRDGELNNNFLTVKLPKRLIKFYRSVPGLIDSRIDNETVVLNLESIPVIDKRDSSRATNISINKLFRLEYEYHLSNFIMKFLNYVPTKFQSLKSSPESNSGNSGNKKLKGNYSYKNVITYSTVVREFGKDNYSVFSLFANKYSTSKPSYNLLVAYLKDIDNVVNNYQSIRNFWEQRRKDYESRLRETKFLLICSKRIDEIYKNGSIYYIRDEKDTNVSLAVELLMRQEKVYYEEDR